MPVRILVGLASEIFERFSSESLQNSHHNLSRISSVSMPNSHQNRFRIIIKIIQGLSKTIIRTHPVSSWHLSELFLDFQKIPSWISIIILPGSLNDYYSNFLGLLSVTLQISHLKSVFFIILLPGFSKRFFHDAL